MDQIYFFDQLNDDQTYQRQMKPIYSFNLDDPKNEKDVLSWLKGELHWS
jgi:hypothetical protein